MMVPVFLAVVLGACTGSLPEGQVAHQASKIKELEKLPETGKEDAALIDSAQLITGLYEGKTVIPSKDYSGFSYSFDFEERENMVRIRSVDTIAEYKVEYLIVLKDTAGGYSESEFSAFDDSYEFVESYFRVDGKRVDFSEQFFLNLAEEQLTPALIWYDNDFGISSKYYSVNGKDYFLIRGLDLYCNGRQCTGYQIFVIRKSGEELKASAFYFSGLYPYDFENTFLFDQDRDGIPEMFVPKDVDELGGTSDFDIYELEFSRPAKVE